MSDWTAAHAATAEALARIDRGYGHRRSTISSDVRDLVDAAEPPLVSAELRAAADDIEACAGISAEYTPGIHWSAATLRRRAGDTCSAVTEPAGIATVPDLTPAERAVAEALYDHWSDMDVDDEHGFTVAMFADEARAIVAAVRPVVSAEAIREVAEAVHPLSEMGKVGGREWLEARASRWGAGYA